VNFTLWRSRISCAMRPRLAKMNTAFQNAASHRTCAPLMR